jgi:hypothetical protein
MPCTNGRALMAAALNWEPVRVEPSDRLGTSPHVELAALDDRMAEHVQHGAAQSPGAVDDGEVGGNRSARACKEHHGHPHHN